MKQQSSQRKTPISPRSKKAWQVQNNVKSKFLFLTLKASCIRNLFHQDRPWLETSTAMFWDGWRKTSSQVVQQFLAPAPWQRVHPHVTPYAAAFDLNENDSNPPPSLLTRPRPL
jgi:hypothetical protein